MALHDYRQLIEIGKPDQQGLQPFVAVELAEQTIRLEVAIEGMGVSVALNEGDAGAVVDAIAGALRVLAAPPD